MENSNEIAISDQEKGEFSDLSDAVGGGGGTSTRGNNACFLDLSDRNYVPIMVKDRYAAEYNMKHKYRGKALIFNHEFFKNEELKRRVGTEKDCADLVRVLTKLGFDVDVHQDLCYKYILRTAEETARLDHTDNDCLLVVILSHGGRGVIYANDTSYKLDSIWSLFTNKNCKSLAGKPRLFIVQACRGGLMDPGITMKHVEYDACPITEYNIPLHPDFLIAYSTVQGCLSWRREKNEIGSWFIQSLCKELDLNWTRMDILTLLTFVNQRVSIDYESSTSNYETNNKKESPNFVSMLTRILIFSNPSTEQF